MFTIRWECLRFFLCLQICKVFRKGLVFFNLRVYKNIFPPRTIPNCSRPYARTLAAGKVAAASATPTQSTELGGVSGGIKKHIIIIIINPGTTLRAAAERSEQECRRRRRRAPRWGPRRRSDDHYGSEVTAVRRPRSVGLPRDVRYRRAAAAAVMSSCSGRVPPP